MDAELELYREDIIMHYVERGRTLDSNLRSMCKTVVNNKSARKLETVVEGMTELCLKKRKNRKVCELIMDGMTPDRAQNMYDRDRKKLWADTIEDSYDSEFSYYEEKINKIIREEGEKSRLEAELRIYYRILEECKGIVKN